MLGYNLISQFLKTESMRFKNWIIQLVLLVSMAIYVVLSFVNVILYNSNNLELFVETPISLHYSVIFVFILVIGIFVLSVVSSVLDKKDQLIIE